MEKNELFPQPLSETLHAFWEVHMYVAVINVTNFSSLNMKLSTEDRVPPHSDEILAVHHYPVMLLLCMLVTSICEEVSLGRYWFKQSANNIKVIAVQYIKLWKIYNDKCLTKLWIWGRPNTFSIVLVLSAMFLQQLTAFVVEVTGFHWHEFCIYWMVACI